MESVNTKSSVPLPTKILSTPRIVTLLGSILVALSSGTNYIYSAYAPQLGARLRVSHTQLNIIGLAGNMGVTFGPFWGRVIDRKGPRIPLISASICLFVGYMGIKQVYDGGIGNDTTVSTLHFTLLIVCSFMTSIGGSAGAGATINTTAKSFPSSTRATTTGLVLSGYGLSAFWFSLLAHTLFPGDTSGFLLVLALGTAIPTLVGLFTIKHVPLPPTSLGTRHETADEGYRPIPSEDVVLVGESLVVLDLAMDAEMDINLVPLSSRERDQDLSQVPVPPSAVGLDSPADVYCEEGVKDEEDVKDEDGLPDIHGKRLWLNPDFYLIFIITGICSGIGLMYINNVGSIAQALYAKTHTVFDDVAASKWQAAQVSILSLGNFAGRVLIGLISDLAYTRLHLPRTYCLCIVSSLFILSQVAAIVISSVETLWITTLLLGLAYGSLWGSFPAIMIEWFGLAHFSENSGYVSFSPIIGGNLFSLMFGHNWDSHVLMQDAYSSLGTRVWSLMSRELPSERQCLDGKACYLQSFQVTLVGCIISLGLSWWAGIRDGQRLRSRHTCIAA